MHKTVSILSPCYNVAPFIEDFLDSLYNQTYKHLEIILVNDGSTDETYEIIKAYTEKMISAGYKYCYFSQTNSGQAAAINKALQHFTGDYLTWLDPDDKLPYDAIEKKVTFLEKNPNIGTVVSNSLSFDERTLKFSPFQTNRIPPKEGKDNLFYDLILGVNSTWNCGCYMVRSSMFREAMPKPLTISAPVGIGQNMQMILPIVYKFPIGYIDDITYYYRVRSDSHSHMRRTYEEEEKRIDISEQLLYDIVSQMEIKEDEVDIINNVIINRILHQRLNNMSRHHRQDNLDAVTIGLKKNNSYGHVEKIIVWSLKYPFVSYVMTILSKLKKYAHIN